ncbi:triple gene block 3 protein [Shallot virus S]|uniref:Movement protein TGBp3 n=1 Tax=Shallot virus S TaxID=2586033 RepID=A0AAE6FNI7_9VIRU|nr:triple gene block 3 protein [Shallot virus S]QCY49485.1 triple gene block 3 protein [Shallot virus S]
MLSQPLLISIACVIVTLALLLYLDSLSARGCTVIISGESVKLLNCVFNREFVEYASKLKPFGSL